MEQRIILPALTVLLLAGPITLAFLPRPTEVSNVAGKQPVVVELFTSQGCSSCPPADEALMDLVERSARDGSPVYALSFHVDYWNRLGWKDPFSAAAWSERQRTYSGSTGDGVYTPQCVVNGTKSFVGSHASELNSDVNSALANAASNTIQAHAERGDGMLAVQATITGDVENKELVAVLVENGLSSQVLSGENRGRRLAHVNVVRALEHVPLVAGTAPMKLTLNTTSLKDPQMAKVIIFVQEKGQGAITGAAEAVME